MRCSCSTSNAKVRQENASANLLRCDEVPMLRVGLTVDDMVHPPELPEPRCRQGGCGTREEERERQTQREIEVVTRKATDCGQGRSENDDSSMHAEAVAALTWQSRGAA